VILRAVQVVAQLLPEHGKPLHRIVLVEGRQVPFPLHFPAGVTAGGFPPQVWLPQVVCAIFNRQVPRPSHLPS
jgi:hypothetical protein